MYISTSSTVLEVGATSKLFSISRSVRQRGPMAPFLFFFFAKTLFAFLNDSHDGILGIHLPYETLMLDAKYENDTIVYVNASNASC